MISGIFYFIRIVRFLLIEVWKGFSWLKCTWGAVVDARVK
jgi:hypothetical protein